MTDSASRSSRLEGFLENPRRALWRLAVPMMIGMSLQTAYMLADMFFVGRLSSEALAALAFNMPLLFLGLGVVFGIGSGVTAVIARSIGSGDKRLADASAEHALALGLVLSVVFTTVAFIWGRDLLALLGVSSDLMPLAWDYFSVIAAGYVFLVMSTIFRSILAGEGDMRTPVMIQGAGTLLNIALDPIFIFTLGLGVKGAALATVLSQAAPAAVFVYFLFFRGHAYVTFDLGNFRFSPEILADTVKIGAPASFSFLVMAVGGAVFNRILVVFSESAVAAYQVGTRIDYVYMLPVISISASLVTLVGMFHGAKRGDLIRGTVSYALTRSVAIAVVVGGAFFFLAPELFAGFSDSAEIKSYGISYLRIGVFAYPFIAVIMLTGRVLQGLGKGVPVLVLSLLRVVLLSAPAAFVFVFWMNEPVTWVWIAIVGGVIVTAVVALFWLKGALALTWDEETVSSAAALARSRASELISP
jgi:MATE family, multidrug efflux pump